MYISGLLYTRELQTLKLQKKLRGLKIEFIDRFGLLPAQTNQLFDVMRLRQRCEVLAIEPLELNAGGARIVFANDPDIEPVAMFQLIQKHSDIYRFDGKQILPVVKKFEQLEEAQAFVDRLLYSLALPPAAWRSRLLLLQLSA